MKRVRKRSPENTQTSLSLKKETLRRVDEAAEQENRSRSNWLQHHIERILEEAEEPYGNKSSAVAAPPAKKIQKETRSGAA